nr:PREDICTED: putative leucine-rich repeat-containing protein DDB_G0290503 isoform X2 [Megachile rotundata]
MTKNNCIRYNEDHNCTATNETTGELCGETESLKIIDELQRLYETRIKNVDHELKSEFDQACMKLEISKEWIRNLREENIMLVQVVEDLEQIACSKVKLLEQKLRQSSIIVSDNMSKSNRTKEKINTLSNRISDLEKDEEYMRQKIEFLQSDIRGLLELIRRAVQENKWNLDGIKFLEIQPSDIPAPMNCTCDQGEMSYRKMQSLKVQIEQLQEKEKNMIAYQKELEDKLIDLNTKLQTKEDVITKYISQFQNFSENLKKQAKFEDENPCNSFMAGNKKTCDFQETCIASNDCVDMKTCQQNQVISYLTKVKSLMEQEKEDLLNLKIELEKTIEKLCCGTDEEHECDVNDVMHKVTKTIEYINKIYSKKEKSIAVIKSLSHININGHFKLMETLKACASEAQVTMENIKDEMNVIVSTFKFKHDKYADLNKEVLDVENQLIRTQEKISETINQLQLQEEERTRHNQRITSGNIKLKDIKNEINHIQSRFLVHINGIRNNESLMTGYTEMCMCNDLLYSVIEEIEQTSHSLQRCCFTSDLEELKNHLHKANCSIKKLQEKADEALTEHNTVETTFSQKEQKLEQLEKEIDTTHLKIQNILEVIKSSNEQISDDNIAESQLYTQALNEILQTKQNLYKLRKEHDELMFKISQKTLYQECDEKTCLWKSRVTDLQDQVKILQHETKCNVETNNFLRNSIESMEEELRRARVKSENFRRSHSIDNMELKKHIIELENTLKLQREIECTLRQQLSDNEIELKKSKELLTCSNTEHNTEETLSRCGCYQFRHDTMTVPQLFKTLQDTMKSTKYGLQELKAELKKLLCEDAFNYNSSIRSLKNLMDKLQKYEDELDSCSQEIDKLKNTLYSKDKLLENMDEIIRIQKDSIVMTQAELKELHQKLQEKIDNQDQIISQYEKEKKELIKQNELQVQTIGHLQNAVVEAKKCIDQMGHKAMSDVSEQWPAASIYSQGNVHDV